MIRVRIGDLVWIKWEDHYSCGNGGWMKQDKVDLTPMLCETVGFVLRQDKYRLATTAGHDGQVDPFVHGNYMVCPKRMIIDFKILRKAGKIWK